MSSSKLTVKAIESFVFEGENANAQDIRWDSQITGFGVRIYPSGKKSYILSYRIKGRKKLMVLGSCNKLTLDQARKSAQLEFAKVLNGVDPSKQKHEKDDSITFAELCQIYLERHAKLHKKSWREDERRINSRLIPALGRKRIVEITREDLAKLHYAIAITDKKPIEANRIITLVRPIFELARERWQLLPETHLNPAKKIILMAENSRERYVKKEEVRPLIDAINGESNVYIRGLFWLYLLTGLRKNELLQAQWQHVDWERKVLHMPMTKNKTSHEVPLSSEALAILEALPRLNDNPYIFAGKSKGAPLVNIAKAWIRVRKQAKLEDVRLHDLRRTLGSWLAQSGESLSLIGKVLNHKNSRATEVYARFSQNNIRDALENHTQALLSEAGKSFSL